MTSELLIDVNIIPVTDDTNTRGVGMILYMVGQNHSSFWNVVRAARNGLNYTSFARYAHKTIFIFTRFIFQ